MTLPDDTAAPGTPAELASNALTVATHRHGEAVVVAAAGEVDMLTAPRLREQVVSAMAEDPAVLVIDLLGVSFLGSSGLAVLVEAEERLGERTRLRVVAEGPATLRPLRMTGLADRFALFGSSEEALRSG